MNLNLLLHRSGYFLFVIAIILPNLVFGQFQRQFGTSLDETFSKVIPSGSNYYVLGSAEAVNGQQPRATVTRLNAAGELQWTLSLDVASQWNDAVLTPGGNIFLVGSTLPLDPNTQSIMGVVTSTGAFQWVRAYNADGRDAFSRVVRNPVPNNPGFPYYVLGAQIEPGATATWDDVVLLTVSETGNIGWKKKYSGPFGSIDDEFMRDMEALPNGDLLLSGNLGNIGVIFKADNAGAIFNAAGPEGIQFSFIDMARSGNNIYAVGTFFPGVAAHLMKFDSDIIIQWQVGLPDLTAIRQVWTSGSSIYVTGSAAVNGLERGVVLKFQDGANAPVLQWMKYLEVNETAYSGGTTWPISSTLMAYTDGRVRPDGFGQNCAFISVSNLELNTCMTQAATATTITTDYTFNSPVPPSIDFVDILPGNNLLSSAINWQEANSCPGCVADFTFTVNNCGTVSFTNQSDVPTPASWQWSFPGASPATSTAQNPVVTYPGCGAYTVCLIATGGGACVNEVCKTVNIVDNTPPVITCPQNPAVATLPGQCYYSGAIPQATATDNCAPSPTITYSLFNGFDFDPVVSNTQFPKGSNTIRCRAVDWCGNQSTCTYQLIVNDQEVPEFDCPISLSVIGVFDTSSTHCTAIVQNIGANASDNCPMLNVQWQLSGATTGQGTGDASGTLFNQGATTVTYTATDMAGNTATCSFTINVVCPVGNIKAFKYHDLDCDGVRDVGPDGVPIDPALAGWGFIIENTVTSEQYFDVTNSEGLAAGCTYCFPPAPYLIKEMAQPGWTPSNPQEGVAMVDLNAGEDILVEFGNCLTCSCEGMDVILTQEHEQGDTSAYYFTVLNNMSDCIEQMSIVVESGELLSAELLVPEIGMAVDDNIITLTFSGNFDWSQVPYVKIRIHNSDVHSITINSTIGQEQCIRAFTYPSPPPVIPRNGCCPEGTTNQGPNLVINGNFNITAPPPAPGSGYTSDYTWSSTGTGAGRFSVLNGTQVSAANGGYWHCVGRSGSPLDPFMIVDGAVAPNKVAWRQTVPIAPAVTYSFEAWFNNIVRPSYNYTDAIVELSIVDAVGNVVASSTPLTLPESPNQWEYLCLRWTSPDSLPAGPNYTLEIRSLSTDFSGNDFAIDDISFRRCVNCAPLPTDVIAWLPMDETGGETTIYDIINGHLFTSLPGAIGSGGPAPVQGKVDFTNSTLGALHFTGPTSGAYLSSNNPVFNFGSSAFSIDAWVNTSMTTQTEPIVDKLGNQNSGYAFSISGTPALAYPTLAIGTVSNGVQVFQGPPIAIGQWNFVAVVVSPPTVTFYVGGDPGGGASFATLSHNIVGTTQTTNNLPLLIGQNPANPHKNIIIDELEIFKRALTPIEVDKIWAADNLGKCRKACPEQCAVNTIDISTGADPLNANNYLAPGGVDPQWMLVSAPPPGISTPQPANLIGAYPSWGTPVSTWISAFPYNNYGFNNCSSGVQDCSCPPYVFERRFCVCKTTQATFNFDFWTDNNGSVELWKEDVFNPGTFQLFIPLDGNCNNLNAVTNFTTPLHVNTTQTLPPGRYALRINNWNISGIAMGVNLHGTVSGLDLESDLCCSDPVGSLCVTKYHDLDCNGLRDIDLSNWTYIEPGLPNWTFQVTGPSGTLTGASNQQGQVCFTGLTPGTYTVTELLQTGWTPSQPASGSASVVVNAYNAAQITFGNCTEDCTCGPFDFLYSVGRGPLLSKNCGDVLYIPDNLPFQFIPSFACNGNCVNTPTIDYILTGPVGFNTVSANGVPISALPIIASTFTIPGTYQLTIIGHCDGNLCPCELTFIYPGDCCKDQQIFLANIESFVDISVDNNNCKATLNIGNLPTCDYLEWVNWGDGSATQYGPFDAGDMVMHTYSGSGSYIISYLAIEKDLVTNLICFEKILYDTIFLSCEDSWCPFNFIQNGDFSVGTPTINDEDICNAPRWCGIWTGNSTGDLYNTTSALPPGTPPVPVSQGTFAGFWCRKQGTQTVWREGVMNELQHTIQPNSGCYELSFKLACLGFHFGTPILNAYGVFAPGGLSSGNLIDGDMPSNTGLFPAGSTVQLGTYPIPATCDNDFLNPAQNISFTINSNTFPTAGITHIFFTRDDNTNGGVYIAIDDVCLKQVPCQESCGCAGADNLSFVGLDTVAGGSIPAICGSLDTIVIPCDVIGSGSFWFHGDVHCTKDSCLQDDFTWSYTALPPFIGVSNNGVLSSNDGKDGHFDIQLNYADFAPGTTYALSVTHYCGDSACVCTVYFQKASCDTCTCGHFEDMFWRPSQGAQSQPIVCGDQLTLGCTPPGFNVQFSGNFACVGVNCPPPVINWVLREKVSQNVVTTGTTSGPNWQISIPSSYFVFPTVYELVLTGVCDGVVCELCSFMIMTSECPCTCGMFDNVKLINKKLNTSQQLSCSNQSTVGLTCPPAGKPYKVTGKLNCNPANCTGAQLHWELRNHTTGAVAVSGNQPGPWFSVTLSNTVLTGLNGLYDLVLTGLCGADTCVCILPFDVSGCPVTPPCPCNQATFANNVAAGFNYQYDFNTGFCQLVFRPNQLTCEMVTWTVQGQNISFSANGVTTGNQPFTVTFPTNTLGYYKVTMTVEIPGTPCKLTFCQYLTVNCLIVGGGICIENNLGNPGFDVNATPGILGIGGASEGWSNRAGTPEVIDGNGCLEPYSIRLNGRCLPDFVDIVDHQLNVQAHTGFRISACYRADAGDILPGTELVVRLSDDPQSELGCTGNCVEVLRMPIESAAGDAWNTLSGAFLLDGFEGNKFLTLHIENDLAYDDPDAGSTILLDDICFEQNDSSIVTGIKGINLPEQALRLYPNPTTGALTLDWADAELKDGLIQLSGPLGQTLRNWPVPTGADRMDIALDELPGGMYYVKLLSAGRLVAVRKVVKR